MTILGNDERVGCTDESVLQFVQMKHSIQNSVLFLQRHCGVNPPESFSQESALQIKGLYKCAHEAIDLLERLINSRVAK